MNYVWCEYAYVCRHNAHKRTYSIYIMYIAQYALCVNLFPSNILEFMKLCVIKRQWNSNNIAFLCIKDSK